MHDWITLEAPAALDRLRPRLEAVFAGRDGRLTEFVDRLEPEFERIFRLTHQLYGWRWDFAWQLEAILAEAAAAALRRPKRLRRRDREADLAWLTDPATVWASVYVDHFAGDLQGLRRAVPHLLSLGVTHLHLMPLYAVPAGPNDGGYAVSDYRRVRPDLGTTEDLASVIEHLGDNGIGVALDFVTNHTADDHPWAEAAKRGDPHHRGFYFVFDDRTVPDRYAPSLREIFPDRGGDAFTWRTDLAGPHGGAWVWTTFHEYQWDLDYRNPAVLAAMLGELLFLANLGPAVVRMDATPFLWKQEGTTCENLPEAHLVLQLLEALTRVTAPSVLLLSEAIVHPDDVARFVRPDECRLGYNPLVMALTWEAVATRRTELLADALTHRMQLPEGCQWLTYLRCHDDIGWGFADEDALRLGLDPAGHRRFLNAFYAGEFEGSFAAGARFQDNPRTGDARISGTLASLAGLERSLVADDPPAVDLAVRRILALHTVMATSVGIPLLFLGDEIAQLNDYAAAADPARDGDNRWMHRPRFDWEALARAEEGLGPAAPVLAGVRRLLRLRRRHPALGAGTAEIVPQPDPAVLAYLRAVPGDAVAVVVNLADREAVAHLHLEGDWVDDLAEGNIPVHPVQMPLGAYGVRILTRRDRR